jgi:osmotically-inducible protein OsmY
MYTWPVTGRMHAMSQTKDIRDTVERELSYDPLVDDSDISVKNINGDVALDGTVPSYPQYLEAAAAARRVAGVKLLRPESIRTWAIWTTSSPRSSTI